MTIDIITVRGTGEPWNGSQNMLANVTRKLDVSRFRMQDLSYPATVGPGGGNLLGASEAQSVEQGVENLAATIRHTPNVVGLLAYSLGAMVVSRFLERKAAGDYFDCEVAFAGLIANPLRRESDSVGDIGVGYGIAGQRGEAPARIPVYEIANPLDGITCCPAGSPLHALADELADFSLAGLPYWAYGVVYSRWLDAGRPCALTDWRHYKETTELVAGYLEPPPLGQHTAYSHETMPGQPPGVTYCDRLAQLINEGPWR